MCHSSLNVALYWLQLVNIYTQTLQSNAIWDEVIFQGHITHSISAESNQEWIGHCFQCEGSSLKFGQIKLISPRFQNGFRGVGRHLVFLLLPTVMDQLTSSAETEYSLFETQPAFLCGLEIKVMPILRFLNICICTVLKRLRTEEHCRPMADKIKWIGWRTPIGRHVIPACVPIGRASTL